MKHLINKVMTCIDSGKCSDQLRKKLENKFHITLMKQNKSDPLPDGSISILHLSGKHTILIETYTKLLSTKQIEETL